MAPKARGSVVDKDGGKKAQLQCERKTIRGPTRHGPHAAAEAESDRQTLREANTSLASLEAAASALKSAAAASETPAERNERVWKKQRTVDPMDANESGVSQPASSSASRRDIPETSESGASQPACLGGSKRRKTSSDVHPAGPMRHGANEASPPAASIADLSTDDKINEGKRILKDILTSNPDHDDADWLRQMLDWGVALVCSVPPTRSEKRELGAKPALDVPRLSKMKEHEYLEAIKQKWVELAFAGLPSTQRAPYWWHPFHNVTQTDSYPRCSVWINPFGFFVPFWLRSVWISMLPNHTF